jgi:hypothetical protein
MKFRGRRCLVMFAGMFSALSRMRIAAIPLGRTAIRNRGMLCVSCGGVSDGCSAGCRSDLFRRGVHLVDPVAMDTLTEWHSMTQYRNGFE